MKTLRLKDLVKGLGLKGLSGTDPLIRSLTNDSRQVVPGSLFAALPSAAGSSRDCLAHARQAAALGAQAVLAPKPWKLDGPTVISTGDTRSAWGNICSRFYGNPTDRMKLVGITGTNGKTTVAYLVRGILKRHGMKPAMIGTVAYSIAGRTLPALNTTPGALQMQQLMARAERAGSKAAVLEVSSHALDQGRVIGCSFAVGVFTNLTQDHLDYHHSMARYRKAKTSLFAGLRRSKGMAVWNLEDPAWKAMAGAFGRKGFSYSLQKGKGDLRAENIELAPGFSEFDLVHASRRRRLKMSLAGRYNISNALAAAAAGLVLGLDLEAVAQGLEKSDLPPGRLQKVGSGKPLVLVDYAHTPDALARALGAVREACRGRVICVFGAGGDRDRGKRPLMGKAAWLGADLLIVTSDNPRTEDPQGILDDIFKGIPQARGSVMRALRLPDRSRAIHRAVKLAREEDVVLIAGKGHEDYQILGVTKVPFSDVVEARLALKARG